jgi:hypothetical protein
MDFITHLQQTMMQELPAMMAGYEGEITASSLSEMETAVKQMLHEVGNEVLRQWVEAQEERYPEDHKTCPHCGEPAGYVRRREGMSITLQGRLFYRRAYYLCAHCQQGFYPLDDRLGIQPGEMSAEVVKLAALIGVQDAFGTGQEVLAQTTLLELSPNSIRKACQMVGKQVLATEQQLQQRSQNLEAQREQRRVVDKPQRLYGSLDGFMVWLEDGWHEMKAGAWWTTTTTRRGELQAQNIRYYVDALPASDFAELVWATAFDLKADQAIELVFVADGAEWIWRIVQQHYPQAVQIVDWYHATAYLTLIAQAAFTSEPQRQDWLARQRDLLWQGRLGSVFHACRAVAEQAPVAVNQTLVYFAHNRTRLRYATFRTLGYQIGSGSMESGCKQLGLARL